MDEGSSEGLQPKTADIGFEHSKLPVEQILTPEQLSLVNAEFKISAIKLREDGKIDIPDEDVNDEEVKHWQSKEGIIDAKRLEGIMIIIFNSKEYVPEGCPKDLMQQGRSGEYDASLNIAFTDIANTWDALNNRYQPSWVQQNLRHELRHGLVSGLDQKHHLADATKLRRVVDQHELETSDPELAKQLSYLDELHSQYFDVIEGDIGGHSSFRSLDSRFYSMEGEGTHAEVASATQEGQESAKKLFHYLQGMILLKRMSETTPQENTDLQNMIYVAGAIIATERSLSTAEQKLKTIWQNVLTKRELLNNFNTFLETYKPSERDNTPLITQELRGALFNKV